MKGELSPQSSPRLMSWGMTSNGKCLTARISESPRIGKECSLLEILEERPDQKYFLSEKATQEIWNKLSVADKETESTERGGSAQPSPVKGEEGERKRVYMSRPSGRQATREVITIPSSPEPS